MAGFLHGPYLQELDSIAKINQVFKEIGSDPIGIEWMKDKTQIYPLLLKEVKSPAANILKQQMLSLGGEAVVGRWVINLGRETSDVLLLGTRKHYRLLREKLKYQPWGLKDLAVKVGNLMDYLERKKRLIWEWPDRKLVIGENTLIMGILNITPDSFSDGGKFLDKEVALQRASQMVAEGADIIDVGGESTRPGSNPVSSAEELERVMPILEVMLQEIPIPISLDTYKAEVAQAALSLGVHIINDVGGGQKDPRMISVVAEKQAPVMIMHKPDKKPEDHGENLRELVVQIISDLEESVQRYEQAGLPVEKMMIDPGIGFGKGPQGNLAILENIKMFESLQKPLLLGASRKSFIGAILGTSVNERLEGSLAAAAWGIMKNVACLRVHDVQETVRLKKVLEAIRNER